MHYKKWSKFNLNIAQYNNIIAIVYCEMCVLCMQTKEKSNCPLVFLSLVETCPNLNNRCCSPSSRKGCSSLPAAFLTFPFLYKTAVQFSIELSRLGERCEMFQSLQLHFTAWHGLLYLQCNSEPCFKTVASSDFLFTVMVTSPGASLLYNNNTDWTGD